MRDLKAGLAVGLVAFALAPWASAATYVVDNFGTPAAPVSASAVGLGTVYSSLVPGSPGTTLYVVSDVNPSNAVTTISYGGGAVTLTSPLDGRAYAQADYGAFGSSAFHVNTTPYNYFELSFARANRVLNINAVMYSASPTGPAIYYDGNGINVAPAVGGGPFNVFFAIPSPAGFNRADVNGILFEIDVAGSSLGSSWAIDKFALTSGIPEPAAWTLMLVGLGGLGGALRRSRRENAGAPTAR